MKKPLLLGITGVTLIALTVTTLYAQVASNTSIIDRMKAAVHTFTLAGELNAGQTGYESAPIAGKKTGGILTAGEWNRVLELVADGSSTGSVNYLQLTTPASVTFTEGGKVPFTTLVSQKGSKITQSGGEVTLKGGSSYRISADLRLTSPNSAIGYTIIDKSVGTGVGVFGANYTGTYTGTWGGTSALAVVSPTVDTTYFIKTSSLSGTPYSTSAGGHFTVEELGGGGGSTSSGWVDVPLTDTNPFDQQCMYRFVTQGQTYYVETVHEDRLYWIYNMYFDKANKSNLVGGIAPYNVATKLEKFCGGGSNDSPSPGAAKAWITYRNMGGTVSTVGTSYGVQSVASAAGVTNFFNYDTIITLKEPLLDTNYAVIVSPAFNSGSGYYEGKVLDWVCIWSKVSATSLGVHCAYPGYGAYGNSIVSVTVFSM